MQGRRALQCVQMVFVETLFGDWRSTTHRRPCGPGKASDHVRAIRWLDLIYVTGHQFDACAVEGFTTLVVERYPSDKFKRIAFGRRNHVVISMPIHAAGHITEFRLGFASTIALDAP